MKKQFWLYVLLLEQNKYYIGITSQTPEMRLKEHLGGRKTYWTEKYPPIKIIDQVFLGDLSKEEAKAFENRVLRRYIREKGVNKVRGGDLTDPRGMIVRFGYIFDTISWEAITIIVFQWLLIAYLYLDKYNLL